jgi:hypothetical protein
MFSIQACSKKSDKPKLPESNILKHSDFGIIIAAEAYLRVAPYVFSSKLYNLYKSDTVKIMDKSAEKVTIGKNTDYWYHVAIDNGMTGWIFGANMSVVSENQEGKVNTILEELKGKEIERLYKELVGKWWSLSQVGNYTNRVLEIHPDKKYKAYYKDGDKYAKVGEYSIDYENKELVLSGGNPYNAKITYAKKGLSYELIGHADKNSFEFAMISKTIDPKEEPKDFEDESEQELNSQALSNPESNSQELNNQESNNAAETE